jgi:hypothetical protein
MWQSKRLNYQQVLNTWNTQQRMMERRILSIETLLNNFKELGLKTKSSGMQHRWVEDSITTTEVSTMDLEEKGTQEVDFGVETGHAVNNLFNSEEEVEVLIPPINEVTPLNSQQIRHPTTANNSIFTTNPKSDHTENQQKQIEPTLHNSSGRHFTWRSPDTVLQILDTNNSSLMATLHCETGIQNQNVAEAKAEIVVNALRATLYFHI